MRFLGGIENFATLIVNNWTTIAVCLGLLFGFLREVKVYNKKSTDEKVAIAKKQIKEQILKMVAAAESDFKRWEKSGSIKRSQVISEIYEKHPILSKVVDQEEIIQWIDDKIAVSLTTLNEIIEKNQPTEAV